MEVTGKVVVVTGDACGIGEALCRRFVNEVAKAVVVADVNEAAAKAMAHEIKGAAVACDFSKEDDVIRLVRFTEETYGPHRSVLFQCRHHRDRRRRVSE